MIITCPACATQFRLPDGALGASGRKLRCSACRHVWFAAPSIAELEPADAPPAAAIPAEATPPAMARETIMAPAAPPPAGPITDSGEPDTLPAEEEAGGVVPAAADTPDQVEDATVAEPEHTASPGTAPDDGPEVSRASPATGWEPSAIAPRGVARPIETPRTGLRLVQPGQTPPEPEPEPAAPAAERPATPSYDVTRVVQPDAAPQEPRQQKKRPRRGGGLLLVLLILVGIAGLAWFERTEVMRYLPQTAPLYAKAGLVGAPGSQGLQLRDVSFRVDDNGGESRLVVTGSVVNVGQDYRLLPALRGQLLNADREATLTWSFDAMAKGLAPGDVTLFEASYADPPRTGEDEYIFVTFADLM